MTATYRNPTLPHIASLVEAFEKGAEPKQDPTAKRLESIESKLDKLMQPAYVFEGERYVKSNGLFVPLDIKDKP